MDKVFNLTTFDEEAQRKEALAYWLSRPAEERLSEVERLRQEYASFSRETGNDHSEGLLRSLLVIEREPC